VHIGNRSRLKEQGLLAVLELGDWTGLKRFGKYAWHPKERRVILLNRGSIFR